MEKFSNKELLDELERTREDLEDLEKYVQDLFAFLPLPVCALSPQNVIIDGNLAFENLTGFKNFEFIGQPLANFFVEKEEIEKMLNEVKEKDIIENKEFTLLTKEKKQILVSVSIGARRERNGEFIGSFVGILDITELKRYQRELEEKVRERTRELQEKIAELEKFQRLAVGRELKMVELKKEIEKLKEKLQKLESKK